MKITYTLVLTLWFSNIYAQINCEAFLYYYKDTLKYEACIKYDERKEHYQFTKEHQMILDEVIKIDPSFSEAYGSKSVAYLKSGDVITWKKLIDKAVELNPNDYLQYRGRMLYKCFRDYKGALKDFKTMETMGMEVDHLAVEKALCYNGIGERKKAIQILEKHRDKVDDIFGLEGYLHFGVLYLQEKNFSKAKQIFLKQSEVNEIAENQYYLALTYKALNMHPEYIASLKEAKRLYLIHYRLSDVYIDPIHKIYLEDIENEIRAALNNGYL